MRKPHTHNATTPADLEEIVPLLQRAGITSVRDLADCSAPQVSEDLRMPAHLERMPAHVYE